MNIIKAIKSKYLRGKKTDTKSQDLYHDKIAKKQKKMNKGYENIEALCYRWINKKSRW